MYWYNLCTKLNLKDYNSISVIYLRKVYIWLHHLNHKQSHLDRCIYCYLIFTNQSNSNKMIFESLHLLNCYKCTFCNLFKNLYINSIIDMCNNKLNNLFYQKNHIKKYIRQLCNIKWDMMLYILLCHPNHDYKNIKGNIRKKYHRTRINRNYRLNM